MSNRYSTAKDRFSSRCAPPDQNGCRLWTGRVNHKGYGRLNVAGHNKSAARFAWELEHGPIEDGMVVDHFLLNVPSGQQASCSRRCVEVSHLRLRTNAENIRSSPRFWERCAASGRAWSSQAQ